MIILFSDLIGGYGGIETLLDSLARRLHGEGRPFQIAVALNAPAPFLDELEHLGIKVYRQPWVPGDRWLIRQRILAQTVASRVKPGDWVFCVRQPMPEIYLSFVRAVHRRGGKFASRWMFAPEFLPPPPGALGESFKTAIRETDAVISVSHCTVPQFRSIYEYHGPINIVRSHNSEVFSAPVAMPAGPPFSIGFIGRIEIQHKNLDTILGAIGRLSKNRGDIQFNVHGGGVDIDRFKELVRDAGLLDRVTVHGRYDRKRDLPAIIARNHLFIYTSRAEGGPCHSLIELLQAGRYVVASPVGGIPDIYEGRPELGQLISPDFPDAIALALDQAIERIASGGVDPEVIRTCYMNEFREEVAHPQWLRALGLEATAA